MRSMKELNEIFESLTEEERASEVTNDAEGSFSKSAFNRMQKKTADISADSGQKD